MRISPLGGAEKRGGGSRILSNMREQPEQMTLNKSSQETIKLERWVIVRLKDPECHLWQPDFYSKQEKTNGMAPSDLWLSKSLAAAWETARRWNEGRNEKTMVRVWIAFFLTLRIFSPTWWKWLALRLSSNYRKKQHSLQVCGIGRDSDLSIHRDC